MAYHFEVDNARIAEALRALGRSETPLAKRIDAPTAFEGPVVVLPSAFNPPTVAHFRMLELAAEDTSAPIRAATLTTRNVDKGLYGAALEDRIGMLLAEAKHTPGLAVVATNAARFVDQAAALTASFPLATFDFVAGYDTLVRIFDEKYYGDMEAELAPFFACHRLLVANRADATVVTLGAFVEALPAHYHGRVLLLELDVAAAAMSSSAARERGARGDGLMLTRAVRAYISEHGLY